MQIIIKQISNGWVVTVMETNNSMSMKHYNSLAAIFIDLQQLASQEQEAIEARAKKAKPAYGGIHIPKEGP